jgi:hypothetical protein
VYLSIIIRHILIPNLSRNKIFVLQSFRSLSLNSIWLDQNPTLFWARPCSVQIFCLDCLQITHLKPTSDFMFELDSSFELIFKYSPIHYYPISVQPNLSMVFVPISKPVCKQSHLGVSIGRDRVGSYYFIIIFDLIQTQPD